MAERIVSPGVFTREKDLSFLPEGIGEIGAALVGPTDMGPAFVPTAVRNLGEFEKVFGKENQDLCSFYCKTIFEKCRNGNNRESFTFRRICK